jgi:ribosome-binding factor A
MRERNLGPSQRQLRVGEAVRHALADLLARGEVRMSPDLRLATIYVMPLGGRDRETVLAALQRHARYLRGAIARRVNLKFAPDIRFRIDERFDAVDRIDALLRSPAVKRDLTGGDDDEH